MPQSEQNHSGWMEVQFHRCVYCGGDADTADHFPPRSVASSGLLLPACRSCNSFLGNSWPFDFDARLDAVRSERAVSWPRLRCVDEIEVPSAVARFAAPMGFAFRSDGKEPDGGEAPCSHCGRIFARHPRDSKIYCSGQCRVRAKRARRVFVRKMAA